MKIGETDAVSHANCFIKKIIKSKRAAETLILCRVTAKKKIK
jgi:hypothetical protein